MRSPLVGLRVLVVGDEPRRLPLVHALAKAGATVRSAEEGRAALGVVLVERVDAIVCEDGGGDRHWIETVRSSSDRLESSVPALAIGGAPAPGAGRTFDDRVAEGAGPRDVVHRLSALLAPAVTRRLPRIA